MTTIWDLCYLSTKPTKISEVIINIKQNQLKDKNIDPIFFRLNFIQKHLSLFYQQINLQMWGANTNNDDHEYCIYIHGSQIIKHY